MPKRVAITIAGAVSLGSYEGGVVYELLEAFRTHNEATDKAGTPDAKIYIDVITGASAGGMTAAMLAQRLMFDGASMVGADTNPLYHAWVERVSIDGLVHLQPDEAKWHSLLSSDLITQIGKEMLEDWLVPPAVLSGPHSTVERDANGVLVPINVGVALTNLNGVDYSIRIVGNDDAGFNYTTSVDKQLFGVTGADRADAMKWQNLRMAAVSSGAFPAAFRPQQLSRKVGDYGTAKPEPPALETPGASYVEWARRDPQGLPLPENFAYCDGGVLQNQPLGIAKNFVDCRVRRAKDADDPEAYKLASERLYVFISPHSVQSTAQKGLIASEITIAEELNALLHTYLRQAAYHDWIVAEQVNQKVTTLDIRAGQLAKAVQDHLVDIAALTKASDEINKLLCKDTTEATYTRLRGQYATLYAGLISHSGAEAAEAFLCGIATLEVAAELDQKDTMKIVAVIADGRTELAGSGIAAFAGFFSRKFREHDYWMGRVKTRLYLQRNDVKQILGITAWPQEQCWGSTLPAIKMHLPNPTSIVQLPMSVLRMLAPGWNSLRYIVTLRPAIKWAALAVLASISVVLFGLLLAVGFLVLLIWAHAHGVTHVILK